MITARLTHNAIISASEEAFSLHDKSCWGEKKRNTIEYSFIEALALIEMGKLKVFLGKKELVFSALHAKAKRLDKRLDKKLAAFIDLRKKGYIVKTALKFGAEFRVYDKGTKPGQDHASWLLYPLRENETIAPYDFAAKNRVATSTNKKLLLALVDDEGDVTYYEIGWFRP